MEIQKFRKLSPLGQGRQQAWCKANLSSTQAQTGEFYPSHYPTQLAFESLRILTCSSHHKHVRRRPGNQVHACLHQPGPNAKSCVPFIWDLIICFRCKMPHSDNTGSRQRFTFQKLGQGERTKHYLTQTTEANGIMKSRNWTFFREMRSHGETHWAVQLRGVDKHNK